MVQERKRAADKRYLDPILATKKDTDDQFHKVHSLVHSKNDHFHTPIASYQHYYFDHSLLLLWVVVVVDC